MTERALPVTILEPAGIDPELLDHSLSLRFDLGQFDPRITFTRASTASYYGSDGILRLAAANEPRIDYDPVTKACKGFLVEEQRTNLLTYSEQFSNAAWSKFESSITAGVAISPDGMMSADKLTESVDSDRHFVYQDITVTSGVSYTVSVFVKSAERSGIRIDAGDDRFGAGNYAEFNLSTKTASPYGNCTAGVVESAQGYLRCYCTFIATTSATSAFTVELHNGTSVSYTGDGTSGIYIWGAQLEAGSFPTSYIPTLGAQVTRAADIASVNELSPWYNAAAGTFVIEHDAASGRPLLSSGANTIAVSQGAGKLVVAYDAAGSYVSHNGGAYVTGPALTFGEAIELMRSASAWANAHCASIRYYPRKLSQGEIA